MHRPVSSWFFLFVLLLLGNWKHNLFVHSFHPQTLFCNHRSLHATHTPLFGQPTETMSGTHTNKKKPTFPEGYVVPDKWTYDVDKMSTIHGSNVPTSGAQTEKELPLGSHDIQLYGLGTPNGMKASIMLEELVELLPDFDYDAYSIAIGKGDQFTSGFVAVNPNSKIPAIYDQSNGARVFESGAVLVYLAEKYQAFLPSMTDNPVARAECLSWVFYQVGSGPYYGGGGLKAFQNKAPMHWEWAMDRYTIETKRILHVMDQHLKDKLYFCGNEYTIADMMHWRWTSSLIQQDFLDGPSYQNLVAWSDRVAARPAVQRGMQVLGMGKDGISERHARSDLELSNSKKRKEMV